MNEPPNWPRGLWLVPNKSPWCVDLEYYVFLTIPLRNRQMAYVFLYFSADLGLYNGLFLLITREWIELLSWGWSQMKALSLRISILIYFLQFYCETAKYAHVIGTCVNFCHFWSMEQPYFSNNLRNKLAKNMGLVPNDSPESEDFRHYLLFSILLSYR